MAEGKKKVIWYTNWCDTFEKLNDDEAGRLIKHFCQYITDKDPTPPDRLTELLFDQIQDTLKRDLKKWKELQERNAANGKKGGRPPKPKETEGNPEKPSGLNLNPEKGVIVKDSVTVTDTVNVNDNDIIEVDSVGSSNEQPQPPKKKRTIFKPPELSEVQAYCQERRKGINAQQWHDHYTANGWMVGKNKMKDWKAAVRTWERNNINNGNNGTGQNTGRGAQITNIGRQDYDDY